MFGRSSGQEAVDGIDCIERARDDESGHVDVADFSSDVFLAGGSGARDSG
jgi:hypothetical protein